MRIVPLSLLAGALLFVLPAHAQDVEINDQARSHFQAGVNLLQDPDGARYEEAYREFKAAYQASPSWKILGNLGIAAMKLERDGEAIEAFQKYLAGGSASLPADEREQFQRDLGTLQAGLVRLSIDISEAGANVLDERLPVSGSPVRNTYVAEGKHLEVGVRAGHHKLTVTLPGFEPAVWELEAVSGANQTHSFQLKRPAPAGVAPLPASSPGAPGTPTAVYVGMAATGVFAVGAGVVGVLALGKKGKFDDANDGSNVANATDLHDGVKTLNLVTDVLIGAAVVSAGVTTYLYLTRPKAEAPASAWVRVRPQVGLQSGSLQLEGAF
jgi:hypothetical protein